MIIDGKKISEKILNRLKEEIKEKQLKLKLAVVLVGDDPNSKIYVRKKGEACERVGIDFQLFKFDETVENLEEETKEIVKDCSGMIIQLPLPERFKTQEILRLIPPEKDVESISPVVCALEYILKEYNISLKDKKVVLVGQGILVGIPVGKWLAEQDIVFSGIEDIKEADVIISGAGKKNLIVGDMVKQGAVVIDVGGDVEFESVTKKASYITPVIGGIGPITVACLLENLVNKYGSLSI